MTVSANDPRQPYVQVADDLRQAIRAGKLKPGERLPSGRKLAEQYGVALLTVQRALDSLRGDNLVMTSRRGTFVQSPGTNTAVKPSGEFSAIMNHLDDLKSSVQQMIEQLDARLTQLENAVHRRRGAQRKDS
jgi:GntR family transcriptional regulator